LRLAAAHRGKPLAYRPLSFPSRGDASKIVGRSLKKKLKRKSRKAFGFPQCAAP
jgi:hypothetical protein